MITPKGGKMKKPLKKNKKYYDITELNKINAKYRIVFGERSNGKTYQVLRLGLMKYLTGKGTMGIIRRWEDDFKKGGRTTFNSLEQNGNGENEIMKLSNGQWDHVKYWRGEWYLAKWNEYENNKGELVTNETKEDTPFCSSFAINIDERYKSGSYPTMTTILFDEFLTRGYYIQDEFVKFSGILSTIIRDRDNVEIYMCANTVSKYSPYFSEMGLSHIKTQTQGTIDVYNYSDPRLKVAVEYASPVSEKGKASDVYFAFDNPRLKMITKGAWEFDIYPHFPAAVNYKDSKIVFSFFIRFDGDTLQADIHHYGKYNFIYIHQKTTSIKDLDKDFIYSPQDDDLRPNWRKCIFKPEYPFEKKILWLFNTNKVCYQDNTIGEIVRNFLNTSRGL